VLKKKREITGEIETAGEPGSSGDIQLAPTAVLEALHVQNRPPERFSVGSGAVADAAEVLDGPDDLPGRPVAEEGGACCGMGRRVGSRKEPNGPDGKVEGEKGEEGEEEEDEGEGGSLAGGEKQSWKGCFVGFHGWMTGLILLRLEEIVVVGCGEKEHGVVVV